MVCLKYLIFLLNSVCNESNYEVHFATDRNRITCIATKRSKTKDKEKMCPYFDSPYTRFAIIIFQCGSCQFLEAWSVLRESEKAIAKIGKAILSLFALHISKRLWDMCYVNEINEVKRLLLSNLLIIYLIRFQSVVSQFRVQPIF